MQTWFITGCSSGIGRGIAEAALASGDHAVVTARRPEDIRDICEKYPDTAHGCFLDLIDSESMRSAVDAAYQKFGKIDVLVNNAGYGYRAAIEESERAQVDVLFQTNVFGPAELMNLCLPKMRDRSLLTLSTVGRFQTICRSDPMQ